MNKRRKCIVFPLVLGFLFFYFFLLFDLSFIFVLEKSPAFAQTSCLFKTKLDISTLEQEPESEVIIGIDNTSDTAPMPPEPPGYNIFMMIVDPYDEIFPSKYKDIKEIGDINKRWLLNVRVSESISDKYPVLTWNTEDFSTVGLFSLWSSNSDGELISQRIRDMTEVGNYTMTEDDGSYLSILCSEANPSTMDFEAGWSMISLPVIPNTSNVANIFPEAVVIYSFERGTGYKRANNLEVGKGYWILFNEIQSHILEGLTIRSYRHSIYSDGWSMIGGCTSQAQASTDNCQISVIYKYVQGSGYQRVTESEFLMPGKGYWILLENVVNQGELTIEFIDLNNN